MKFTPTYLRKNPGRVMWDDNGNIGKRYRRQDEIGTPHCVVVDFQTLEDDTVTVRERDTTEQRRVNIKRSHVGRCNERKYLQLFLLMAMSY